MAVSVEPARVHEVRIRQPELVLAGGNRVHPANELVA